MNHKTMTVMVFTCPACGQEVFGGLSVEIEMPPDIRPGRTTADITPTGLAVSHDCIPKVKR